MGAQVFFAVLCLAIALALAPRWRRMRARGPRDGRYAFVTFNVVGGVVIGVALLWAPLERAYGEYRAERAARYLATFDVRCERGAIEIRNGGKSTRRITVDDVDLTSATGMLGVEPRRWAVTATPRERELAPGASARFELSPLDSGPCAPADRQPFAIQFVAAPRESCDGAAFHMTSGPPGGAAELDTRATCSFESVPASR